MSSVHIPTAIAVNFSTEINKAYLSLTRDASIPGYKVLSDLIIDDNYLTETAIQNKWELMYIRNKAWGVLYTPFKEEHIDIYKLFFEYDPISVCPINDKDLTWFLKSIRTTSYTRWCIAICKNLWSPTLMTSNTTIESLCRDILSYMKELIYKEHMKYINHYTYEATHKNKFKQVLTTKKLGVGDAQI